MFDLHRAKFDTRKLFSQRICQMHAKVFVFALNLNTNNCFSTSVSFHWCTLISVVNRLIFTEDIYIMDVIGAVTTRCRPAPPGVTGRAKGARQHHPNDPDEK